MAEACVADVEACNEEPIGNGPYQFDGPWQHNQAIQLTRYEDYAGTPATPTPSSSASTPTSTPRTTTCSPATSTSWSRCRRSGSGSWRPTSRTATITRPSSNFTYVGFPIYDSRFANPELRQSFSQAIDRQAIIDAIFNGTRAAQSVVSPVVAGSRDDACGELCEYDPAAAKQKFDAAGGFQAP